LSFQMFAHASMKMLAKDFVKKFNIKIKISWITLKADNYIIFNILCPTIYRARWCLVFIWFIHRISTSIFLYGTTFIFNLIYSIFNYPFISPTDSYTCIVFPRVGDLWIFRTRDFSMQTKFDIYNHILCKKLYF
jgi:hypothetical protein